MRVHVAGADAEEQARAGRTGARARATPPVGLAQDRDPEPGGLEHAAEDRHGERRVIDVGVAGDEDDVDRVPAAPEPSRRDAGRGGSVTGTSGSSGNCVAASLAAAGREEQGGGAMISSVAMVRS